MGVLLTSLDGDPGIIHMTPNMCEDFGLQAELADGFAVEPRLLRGRGRRELDVLDTEGIQRLRDSDLGLGVEEGVRKLLAL